MPTLPTYSTGWNKLANVTTVQGNGQNLCPPNNYNGYGWNYNTTCPNVWLAWTSFTFDPYGPAGPRMLSCANGGHNDYLGNECYELNLVNNQSYRLTNPSAPYATCDSTFDKSSGNPATRHTYQFNQKSARYNKLYVWAGIGGVTTGSGCSISNPCACGTLQMWALDTTSLGPSCAPSCSASWTNITSLISGLPTSEALIGGFADVDLDTGLIWVFESFNASEQGSISVFDEVANTWTLTANIPSVGGHGNASEYVGMAVDTKNKVAIMMGSCGTNAPCNTDSSGNPAGNWWCDVSTNCATINQPLTDSSCNALTTIATPILFYNATRQQVQGFNYSNFQTIYNINVDKVANKITCTSENYGSTIGTDIPEYYNFAGSPNGSSASFHKAAYDPITNTIVAWPNIDHTGWVLKLPPAVWLNNTTGSATVAGTIKSVSQKFAQSDIQNYPQASINGSLVTTQADVKQRWSDGSVKWAIVSFAVPSIAANGSLKVLFFNQASGNNGSPISQATMLGSNYNFDMQIQETGTASHTISARTILNGCSSIIDPGNDPSAPQSQPCRYWLKGALVTSVILEDRSTSLAYDFNTDGGTGKPLHPYFECSFFAPDSSNNYNVDCIASVENIWSSSTTSKSMRDQTYAFTLTGGNTSPATLFTQTSFNHYGRMRWALDYCVNGLNSGSANDCATAISIDHNMSYEAYARAIPNYDYKRVISATMMSNYLTNGWNNASIYKGIVTQGPGSAQNCDGTGGIGQYCLDLDVGGTSPWWGILSTWEMMYWFSYGSSGMYGNVLGNTQVGGAMPFHYREADSNPGGNHYDNAGSVNAFGRTVSVNARPNENYMIGPGNNFNSTCSGSNTLTLSLGTVTTANWDSDGMDASHFPEIGYTAALITGKFYYVEETQMAGAYLTAGDKGCPFNSSDFSTWRNGSQGILVAEQIGRGSAWATRCAMWAREVSVDGSPEQAYFDDKLRNTAAFWQGYWGLSNTDGTRTTAYNTGVAVNDNSSTNPLHIFQDEANTDFVISPLDTTGSVLSGYSPWEQQYLIGIFSQLRDLGITAYDSILGWFSTLFFNTALNSSFAAPYMIGTYRGPSRLTATGNWVQNASDWTSGFTNGNGAGLATGWTSGGTQFPCNNSPEDDHYHAGPLAVLGMLYPYSAGGFSGYTAYTTVNQSLYGPTGCMPGMYNQPSVYSNANPKWNIVPRTLSLSTSSPTIQPPTSLIAIARSYR